MPQLPVTVSTKRQITASEKPARRFVVAAHCCPPSANRGGTKFQVVGPGLDHQQDQGCHVTCPKIDRGSQAAFHGALFAGYSSSSPRCGARALVLCCVCGILCVSSRSRAQYTVKSVVWPAQKRS
eukprot:3583152-Rhodomonas_salina.4